MKPLADLWRPVREGARKLIPSRAARWMLIYLPLFSLAVWFGIEAILQGPGAADVKTSLVNAGVFSVRVLVAIGLVHAVTCCKVWDWDLADAYRAKLQRILDGSEAGNAIGAFLVLAGEMVAKILLLWLLLRGLILWPQGVA
jgi:hypothetical protein